MPTKPRDHVDSIVQLLALLDIKSARIILRNRHSLNGMVSALKELYSDDLMKSVIFGSNPFLKLIPKKENN